MKTFRVEILTPFGKYLETDASFLLTYSSKYPLGILPGHADLVSTLDIASLKIVINDEPTLYAIGGGIINVKSNKVSLILDSIERVDEIDINRALAAKKRAEDRLSSTGYTQEEIHRSKMALARALNRLKLTNTKY